MQWRRLVGLVGLLLIQGAAANAHVVRIGVESFDHLPHYDGSGAEYRGFMRELFELFGKRRGYTLQYHALPIAELYPAFLQARGLDAKFPDNPAWMPGLRRAVEVHYSVGVIDYTEGMMVRTTRLGQPITVLRRLGAIRGFDLVPYRQRMASGAVAVRWFDDADSLLRAAVSGTVDGAYLNVAVATYRLQRLGLAGALHFQAEWPHAVGSYALSSVTKPELVREFDAFLRQERAAVESLRKKYSVTFLPLEPTPPASAPVREGAGRPFLTLCHDHLPPFAVARADGRIDAGIKFSLAQRVFREAGLRLKVVQLPWARCLSEAALGRVDGVLPTTRNAERERRFVFSEPVLRQRTVFFYARARYPAGLSWQRFADLRGVRLGMLLGGSVDAQMERTLAEGGVLNRVADGETLMRLLARDRLDLVALDRDAGRYELERLGLARKLAASDKAIAEPDAAIALSRRSGAAQLMPRIDAAIARLHAQGRLNGD